MKKIVFLCAAASLGIAAFSQEGAKPDALKLYQAGNFVQSIAVCEQEIVENPRNLDSYVVLCWSLIGNRQYAEAEQRGARARTLSWYDHRIVEALAEAKYYLGKNSESLALFHEYVPLIPNIGISRNRMDQAYYFMGQLYIRQARYEHADIALSQAVQIDATVPDYWTRLGYAREMAQNYDIALEAYNKALALNPVFTNAVRGKERCLARISSR
ncbi:MAG: tetratricopeptide repeat protein [Spirochaetaceae bacterium]|jgi:tetratricopeptide (TPR) repeat protein|nr:tetratricopeptide repeat protein [Spirochaetaceae bacterium]